jgi:hypothetical protein
MNPEGSGRADARAVFTFQMQCSPAGELRRAQGRSDCEDLRHE